MQLHADRSSQGVWSYDHGVTGFTNANPRPTMPSPGESGYDPMLVPGIAKISEGLFGMIDTAIKGPTTFRLEQRAKIEAEKSKQAQWEAMAKMAAGKQGGGFKLTPTVLLLGGGAAILLIALLMR